MGICDSWDPTYLICIDWEGTIASQGRPSTQELSCQHVDCDLLVDPPALTIKIQLFEASIDNGSDVKGLSLSILLLYGHIVGSCPSLQ